MLLYNTLSGKKEEFKPIKAGTVGMYHCGPTVYNFAHIGNLRAYVFADTLRRTLEYAGFRVRQVMNVTDIGHLTSDADEGDDKMVGALKREGKPMTLEGLREVAEKYTAAFIHDLKALNTKLPHEMPKASEHVGEDIAIIEKLTGKGLAYTTSDGVYFDISKFPGYGTRGGFVLGEQKEGARVAVNPEKHTPRDFSLWKFSKGDIGWQSPWGRGFPGWHIECSAMSRKYLGQPFDIHTGGVDHIATHHQNEIAQSEAAYGAPLANYWLHNEHLIVPSGKMAKSGENFITLQTLKERGIHPCAYRYFLLQTHYRSPLNFSWEALGAAQKSYLKLLLSFSSFGVSASASAISNAATHAPILNDLDTPGVLASVWKLTKEKNRKAILDADRILGLDIENQSKKLMEEMNSVPEEVRELSKGREKARIAKDFKTSDELRSEIQTAGYEVMDTDSGPIIRRKV